MKPMDEQRAPAAISVARSRIVERKQRLREAAATSSAAYLTELLAEVDAALERLNAGAYGICESCHDPIEADRLLADPLVRFCVDHLSDRERRAHEDDMVLAAAIQSRLLPARTASIPGWEADYAYRAAGPVGGDYCELATLDDGRSLFLAVGDVSGKGVAASLLMTHLNAILRSLFSLPLPLPEIVSRANRVFCEATLSSHYATLACGRMGRGTSVELCNAGHCSPLLVRESRIDRLEPSGLPLGLFCQSEYTAEQVSLSPGETLVLYSDGVTEAQNADGDEYGMERLTGTLALNRHLGPAKLSQAVLDGVSAFRAGAPPSDDLTLLAIRRVA